MAGETMRRHGKSGGRYTSTHWWVMLPLMLNSSDGVVPTCTWCSQVRMWVYAHARILETCGGVVPSFLVVLEKK